MHWWHMTAEEELQGSHVRWRGVRGNKAEGDSGS